MKKKIYSSPDFNPELLDKENINRMSTDQIKDNSKVLEIGCATGDIGGYLKNKKNCFVVGVELEPVQARIAKGKINKIVMGNIEEKEVITKLKENYGSFDVVLAMAVIEHLVDPLATLMSLRRLMKKDSIILITLPNIAHWSIRWNLLRGNFDYTEYGIMDRTHLHFYTLNSARELIEEAGYSIISVKRDTVGGGYPRASRMLSHFSPALFTHQILLLAKIK